MKYKNYYNFELGNRDIYSHNDILGMTVQDLFDNELPLSYQYNTIGIPKDEDLTNSPNAHQYTNANGKLRWRSSSKTTEELLEEERKRRAAQEAQTANAQSHLAGFGENSTLPGVTAPKQTLESPMLESEPLVDTNILSDFVGAAKEKWQNRKNNQTLPNTPKENIFQRLGNGIKESVEGFGEPKEVREYKRMTRDIERASRDMQANQVSLEDLVNLPAPNTEPWETLAPIQKNVVLDYPKSIILPEFNPNSKISFSAVEPEKTLTPQESLENNLSDNPELAELSEEELSRVGAEINSEYQKARQQALESQKRQIVGKDTDDMVLQGSVQKSNLKEYIQDSFSRFVDSVNVKKKWHDFQETGFNKDNNMNLNEELQGFLYEKFARPFLPMSSMGVVNAMQNFKLARKDKNINIYDNIEALKNEELISELMNIKDYVNNPILEYSQYAKESKKFSNSPEIKNYVQKNYDKIVAGEIGPEVIEFMSNTNDKNISKLANTFNPKARDRAYFLQHATVLNPKIDEYGYFTCDLADAYDFNKRPDTIQNIPNNWGFAQQEKGNLDNYSTLFHINKEFKKYSKRDRRWRRKKHI